MDFQQSRTYTNLRIAYEDKLSVTSKFLIYRNIAKDEGYIEIAHIYETTASQDLEHARIWLRQINQGTLPSTEEVLLDSIQLENAPAGGMYQEFARIALEEGYNEIANLFSGIANIDFNHGTEFKIQYDNVIQNQVFCKPNERLWICMQCGNIMSGLCAPAICPVCGFPQGYYRPFDSSQ